MPAGGEGALHECEIADATVGRQVVEAARVVDQVVGPGGRVLGEGVPAVEADVRPRLGCPLLGPGDGPRRQVDGVHLVAL